MLTFLPRPLVGVIALFLYAFLSLFVATIFFIVMFLWLIMPIRSWRHALYSRMINMPSVWSESIRFTMWLTTKTKFTVTGLEHLNKNTSYLLIANHQTWLDIPVMQRVFDRHVPQLRYFMKHILIWVPVIGQACWVLGYPFMKRYTEAYLQKHPEDRGKDIETTRKACDRFRGAPITLINYVEGTRVDPIKQNKQKSPFDNLLKPKAGGIAFILSALRGQVDTILNVTIVYSAKENTMWNFLQGKVKEVVVNIQPIAITDQLIGDYQNDPVFRVQFQEWLNTLWEEKDREITEIKQRIIP